MLGEVWGWDSAFDKAVCCCVGVETGVVFGGDRFGSVAGDLSELSKLLLCSGWELSLRWRSKTLSAGDSNRKPIAVASPI